MEVVVTIEMVPSGTLEEEQKQEEEGRLAAIKSSLSDADLDKIIDDIGTLRAFQAAEDTPADRNTIPSLQLSDLKRTVTEYPTDVSENESESGITIPFMLKTVITNSCSASISNNIDRLLLILLHTTSIINIMNRCIPHNNSNHRINRSISSIISSSKCIISLLSFIVHNISNKVLWYSINSCFITTLSIITILSSSSSSSKITNPNLLSHPHITATALSQLGQLLQTTVM